MHATLRRSQTKFDSWQGHWFDDAEVTRSGGGLQSRFDSRQRLDATICSFGMALQIDFEPLAVLTREERVRLSVTDDFPLDGIPLEFAAQTHRDVR